MECFLIKRRTRIFSLPSPVPPLLVRILPPPFFYRSCFFGGYIPGRLVSLNYEFHAYNGGRDDEYRNQAEE